MTALLWSTAAAARVQLPSFEPLAVREDPGGALYLRNGAPMPRIGSSVATRAKQQSAIGRSFRGSAHSLRSALEAGAQDDDVWPDVVSIPMAIALCGGRDWALAAAISAERQITLLLQLEDLVSPSSCIHVDGTSVAVAHRIAERHGVSPLAVAARAALQMGHAVHAGRTNSTPIHFWRRESASRAALSALNFSLTAAEVVQLATGATSTPPPSVVATNDDHGSGGAITLETRVSAGGVLGKPRSTALWSQSTGAFSRGEELRQRRLMALLNALRARAAARPFTLKPARPRLPLLPTNLLGYCVGSNWAFPCAPVEVLRIGELDPCLAMLTSRPAQARVAATLRAAARVEVSDPLRMLPSIGSVGIHATGLMGRFRLAVAGGKCGATTPQERRSAFLAHGAEAHRAGDDGDEWAGGIQARLVDDGVYTGEKSSSSSSKRSSDIRSGSGGGGDGAARRSDVGGTRRFGCAYDTLAHRLGTQVRAQLSDASLSAALFNGTVRARPLAIE